MEIRGYNKQLYKLLIINISINKYKINTLIFINISFIKIIKFIYYLLNKTLVIYKDILYN